MNLPLDDNRFLPKVLQLYLEISQYPILSRLIRETMRRELFARGIISQEAFEREVHQKAIKSQKREGLLDPLQVEPQESWNQRIDFVRSYLTDFYFGYNLPHSLFESVLQEVIKQRVPNADVRLSFNPELAPIDLLFGEAEHHEQLPPEERIKVYHHHLEILVVIIKAIISDHLAFVGLAKEVFSIGDLRAIRERRLGRGKIGGKAAGMLLAWKLIQRAGQEAGLDPAQFSIPDSYYVGADVFYDVVELNNLAEVMNQKYKHREEIVNDYPRIYERYLRAQIPDFIVEQLRVLLDKIGRTPLIFRSSSLLEDSFATSFAGKYDSYFLTNHGTPEENLAAAKEAILRIYASILNPDALIYRQRMNLVDFDERMAILIQKVEGQYYGRYFFPMIAGVGFSRNPFRWTSKIRREDGLLRLVAGLGTRAVDRGDRDYPRMIALSHPTLRPEARVEQLRQYSQHKIDVLDLEDNCLKTLPITDVIGPDFPATRLIAEHDNGQQIQPFIMRPVGIDPANMVFTFNPLAAEKSFTDTMHSLMHFLQQQYQRPVDIEYTVEVTQTWPRPEFRVSLLQCRPLSEHEEELVRRVPEDVPEQHKLFSANRQVPQGVIERVRYIVYVSPQAYFALTDPVDRLEVGRVIGRINEQLHHTVFVLMGPGRWGTSDIQLGVKVTYSDIHYSYALIEIGYTDTDASPEMAYGTHFFQDLVEAKIFPLALFPHDPDSIFNWEFFEESPNCLPDLLPQDAGMAHVVRIIDVPAAAGGRLAEIVMNADQDAALAYLRSYER